MPIKEEAQLSNGVGTLYTVGYAQRNALARIEHLLREEQKILLIDIRQTPYCTWSPIWNRQTLSKRFGQQYLWEQRLGNENRKHKERGIKLTEGHLDAILDAAALLCSGTSLILLCACRDFSKCRRSVVTKLIQDACPAPLGKSEVNA
jgi:uncharacterized protein (DUF488 family)